MVESKYFQKLKCDQIVCVNNQEKSGYAYSKCIRCKGSGIIAGADITETIKPILEGQEMLIKEFEHLLTNYLSMWKQHRGVTKHLDEIREEAKEIIEENTIKVE